MNVGDGRRGPQSRHNGSESTASGHRECRCHSFCDVDDFGEHAC